MLFALRRAGASIARLAEVVLTFAELHFSLVTPRQRFLRPVDAIDEPVGERPARPVEILESQRKPERHRDALPGERRRDVLAVAGEAGVDPLAVSNVTA